MTAAQLKASILAQAIRGKLVPQDPKDEPAEKLLERIREAKAQGEQTKGRARRPATAAPQPITDDEKPFDLPSGWAWVRLKEIVFNHGQKQPKSKFSYIDIGSVDNKHQCLNENETLLLPHQASSRARKIVHEGDVIYSCVRPYLHNVAIIDREFSCEPIASTGFAVMATVECLFNRYLFYFLLSPSFDEYANDGDNAKGIAYPAISDARLYSAIVPLPPLAEQKRIVAKVEELLPLVEKYGAAYERKRKLIADLPEKLRKSILQEAIQGKLVPQDPEDEPAEKLLERIAEAKAKGEKSKGRARRSATAAPQPITDEEKPFDLPKGWAWCRLGDVIVNRDGERIPLSKEQRSTLSKIYDYYGASGEIDKVDRYLFDKPLLLVGEDGANLLSRSTPIAFIASGKYWVNNHAHVLDAIETSILKYLEVFINAIDLAGYVTGTAQPKMNQEKMHSILIPLPPLAEQKRIVAKVEELLADVEQLKGLVK